MLGCHLASRWHARWHRLRNDGRDDDARAEFSTAVAMLREMGMAFWLPEAEAELARCDEPPTSPSA